MGDNSIVVDDFDTAIKYKGSWWPNQSPDQIHSYATTIHLSRNKGDTASFLFNGTSVAVYGILGPWDSETPSPMSTYSIDGSQIYTFASTPNNDTVYQTQFYKSPVLPAGEHTLVITLAVDGGWFWFDYLEYVPNLSTVTTVPLPSNTVTSITVPPLSNTGSLTSTGAILSTSGLPPPSANQNSGSSKVAPGVIIGGTLGGVALLILAFFLVWHCRRQNILHRRQNDLSSTGFAVNSWGRVQPGHAVTSSPSNMTGGLPSTSPENSVTSQVPSHAFVTHGWTKSSPGSSALPHPHLIQGGSGALGRGSSEAIQPQVGVVSPSTPQGRHALAGGIYNPLLRESEAGSLHNGQERHPPAYTDQPNIRI